MKIRALLPLALLAACSSTPKPQEPAGPIRDPNEVRLIDTGMAKPKQFKDIGPVEVEMSAQRATRDAILWELRRAAGLVGADAVIVEKVNLRGDAAKNTNAILLTDIKSTAKGRAILLPRQ
jgi:hypothetical protein